MQMYSVNMIHKCCLHKPIANLSCFLKSIYYAGIKIFSNLPSDPKCLINEKAQFNVALKPYFNTYSFYSVDEYLLYRKQHMHLYVALCGATLYSGVLLFEGFHDTVHMFCVFCIYITYSTSFLPASDQWNAMWYNISLLLVATKMLNYLALFFP
jgi:hypothetical protein